MPPQPTPIPADRPPPPWAYSIAGLPAPLGSLQAGTTCTPGHQAADTAIDHVTHALAVVSAIDPAMRVKRLQRQVNGISPDSLIDFLECKNVTQQAKRDAWLGGLKDIAATDPRLSNTDVDDISWLIDNVDPSWLRSPQPVRRLIRGRNTKARNQTVKVVEAARERVRWLYYDWGKIHHWPPQKLTDAAQARADYSQQIGWSVFDWMKHTPPGSDCYCHALEERLKALPVQGTPDDWFGDPDPLHKLYAQPWAYAFFFLDHDALRRPGQQKLELVHELGPHGIVRRYTNWLLRNAVRRVDNYTGPPTQGTDYGRRVRQELGIDPPPGLRPGWP